MRFCLSPRSRHIFSVVFGSAFLLALIFGANVLNNIYLSGNLVTKPAIVTIQPPPGVYTLESVDKPLYIGMYSMAGAELWYTDDGSSPVLGKWLNKDNKNLKYYGGYSIPVTKTTTFRIVGITLYGDISAVETVRYTIKIQEPEVKKVVEETVSHNTAPEEKTVVTTAPQVSVATQSVGKLSLNDIYKLRVQKRLSELRAKIAANSSSKTLLLK